MNELKEQLESDFYNIIIQPVSLGEAAIQCADVSCNLLKEKDGEIERLNAENKEIYRLRLHEIESNEIDRLKQVNKEQSSLLDEMAKVLKEVKDYDNVVGTSMCYYIIELIEKHNQFKQKE